MSQGKNKQNFQGKECFTRMNFLYQASMLMAGKNNTLSSYYGELCKNISKKAVLRIEPNVKRNLCKRCCLAQQPGITCDLVVPKRKRRKKPLSTATIDDDSELMLSCKLCGQQKKFIINTNYKFWLESSESVAEVCTTQKKTDENRRNAASTNRLNTKSENGKETPSAVPSITGKASGKDK